MTLRVSFSLVVLWCALLALSSFAPAPASADTKIFNKSGWSVVCAMRGGTKIAVTVEGVSKGKCFDLKIHRLVPGFIDPQVVSVQYNAIRLVPPSGEFGGTHYLTGYWDCDPNVGFVQNMRIKNLDIRLDTGNRLRLQGKATNGTSFRAPDFTLWISPAAANVVTAVAQYELIATRDFCVDSVRQAQHEGFALRGSRRITSMGAPMIMIARDISTRRSKKFVSISKTTALLFSPIRNLSAKDGANSRIRRRNRAVRRRLAFNSKTRLCANHATGICDPLEQQRRRQC